MPLLHRALIAPLLIAPLVLIVPAAAPVLAQTHEMFATKEAALQRAKQLKCSGAFAMGPHWMPCKDLESYEKAVHQG